MYFSDHHKEIFKAIYYHTMDGLVSFFTEYIEKKLCTSDVAKKRRKFLKNVVVNIGEPIYVINDKQEDEVYNRYTEFIFILKFLKENNLISFISHGETGKFIPIYTKNEEDQESFDDLWETVKPYIGKKIIVREGFEKFKALGFLIPDEYKEERRKKLEQFFKWFTVLMAIIGTMLTIIINWEEIRDFFSMYIQ